MDEKERFIYAYLDDNDCVKGIGELLEEHEHEKMVRIKNLDESLLHKKFKRENNDFEELLPVELPPEHNPQQEATDAIMSGLIDTATQTSDANDAVMNAMIDIQAQLDEIKTKLGVV